MESLGKKEIMQIKKGKIVVARIQFLDCKGKNKSAVAKNPSCRIETNWATLIVNKG